MKRLIALVLSLVMALSLCAPAWGATTVSNAADLRTALETGGDIVVSGTMDADGTFTVPFNSNRQTEYLIDAETVDSLTGGEYVLDDAANWGFTVVVDEGETLALSKMDIAADSTWVMNMKNNGSLTLSNINLVATDGAGVYAYGSTGTTTLDELNVNHESLTNPEAPWAATAVAASNGQTMVINSGTYVGSTWAVYGYNSGSNITINGGTFKAPTVIQMDGIWSDSGSSVATINGGNFDGKIVPGWGTTAPEIYINGGNFTNFAVEQHTSQLVIKGGTFDADPTAYVAEDYKVVTNGDGTHSVVAKYVAEVGGTKYETLQVAIDAAELVGGTVKLLDDVTLSLAAGQNYCLQIDAPITIDGNNKTLTFSGAYDSRAINIKTTGNVTIKNLTVTTNGERGIQVAGSPVNLTLENVTATSANYTLNVTESAGAAKIALNNCTLTGLCTVNVWGAGAEVTITGGTIVCNDQNDSENYRALNLNSTAAGATITATGVTFDIRGGSSLASNVTTDGEVLIDGSNSGVTTFVASVQYGDYAYLFPTVQDAIDHAVANSQPEVVVLDTAVNSGESFTKPAGVLFVLPEGAVIVSDGAGAYLVVEKSANAAEVDVAKPVVSADKVDTTNTTVNNVVNTIGGTNGVEIDTAALEAVAVGTANENKVTPTAAQADKLNELPGVSDATVSNVAIVVQTYFEVEIEEVKVDGTAATSITVDITPMQQTVATTGNIVESNADIKVGENAVKVGNPAPVKITEPVQIKLQLPTSFAENTKVYITHEASVGTVIYEATVAADHTITFTTTHGFSPFTISVSDPGVKASIGTDNYANLQSAINYAGKDATIVVKASGESAVVKSETSFTVTTESGVTPPAISAGAGYKMVKENVAGGVKYTFTKVTGGYYPYYPPATTPDKLVESAKTADPVGLYFGVTALATLGSALLLKKKED